MLFVAAGALAIGVQVTLLREYLVALQGDETAVGVGLAAWFAGIAAGAGAARALAGARPKRLAAASLAALACSGGAGLLVARWGRALLSVPAGELLPLGPSLGLAGMVFIPPGASVGAGFVALAAAAGRPGADARDAIGRLYVFEAIGSIGAGLALSLVLIPALAPIPGLGVLLAVGLAAATPAARAGLIGGRWLIPVLAATAAVIATPPCSQRLEAATQRARFAALIPHLPLLRWRDTPYQHIAIGGDNPRVVYASGKYAASFPDPFAEESRAHRLMLLAEQPSRVLAFGALETGALRFCLQHQVHRIDLVYLDRDAFEAVVPHLDPLDRQVFTDPRVRIIFDDPRRFLATTPGKYDLILQLQPDPATLLLARGTTVQVIRLVSQRLAPRGAYVTGFSAGPNAQVGETELLGASLYRSLREVFPVVRAAPAPHAVLVAGHAADAVTLAPATLMSRCRQRNLHSEVFVPELVPLLFPPERVAALEGELARAATKVKPTTDDHPVSFLHALTIRQQLAQSGWVPLLHWSARHPRQLVLLAVAPSLLLLLWQITRTPRGRVITAALHTTALTGASGMAWSLMLFFSFQTRVGALYSQLGVLTALFMLGLAAGGGWARRWPSLLGAHAIAVGTAVLIAFALSQFDALLPWRTLLATLHAALLVVAGAAAGAVFPSAANVLLRTGTTLPGAAALIEAADHVGAAAAALLAAVVAIPVFGLATAALILAAIQAGLLAVNLATLR